MCAADARRIAVIGGGWAGCAAAAELSSKGCQVELFEAARTLGGRARRVELNGLSLDNGQHILLGAYRETLRLMRMVGVSPSKAFLSLPLQMRYPAGSGGMDFLTPRLPAPLHMLIGLLRASGLERDDKLSLARFSTTARWMDWKLNDDCSVAELLDRFDQTDRLIRLMWRPLCIAALNTPPERASAQVFLNVLRDSLGAKRAASDMLLPKVDLSALFPERAASFVKERGGAIHVGVAVTAIARSDSGWYLSLSGDKHANSVTEFDAVVVATQAPHAASLLASVPGAPQVPAFEYEPITTCYLRYDATVRLPQAFLALLDDAESEEWGQFVFDRGQLDSRHRGLMAVVVSASGEVVESSRDALCGAVANQLARVFQDTRFAAPIWAKVISEKRATFACTPSLTRPANDTGIDGLVLAGDYTQGDYPATLEAAVQSGVRAARLLA